DRGTRHDCDPRKANRRRSQNILLSSFVTESANGTLLQLTGCLHSLRLAKMQNLKLRFFADFFRQLKLVFERREESVAGHEPFDQREIQIGTKRQRLLIDLGAAANEDLAPSQVGQRCVQLAQVA